MTQIGRLTTWATMQSVTAPTLNNEFDNIIKTWNNTDAGVFSWTTISVGAGTVAKPSVTIGEVGTGWYRPSAGVLAAAILGTKIATVSASGIGITADNNVTLLSISGTNAANDLGAQATNAAPDGATFWSAYNGSVSAVLACFGSTYVGTRMGQTAANAGVVEVAAGPLIVGTNNNFPTYIGANAHTAITINTSQQCTFAKATTFGDVITLPAGSVSIPSWTVGAANTGMYQGSSSGRIAVTLGGNKAVEFFSSGSSDGQMYQPLFLNGGNGGNGVEFTLFSQTAITTAKQIAQIDSGVCLMFVYGTDGSNNDFGDFIFVPVGSGTAPTPISQNTSKGSPAVRTYSKTGITTVNLAMASGTYSTRTFSIDLAPH